MLKAIVLLSDIIRIMAIKKPTITHILYRKSVATLPRGVHMLLFFTAGLFPAFTRQDALQGIAHCLMQYLQCQSMLCHYKHRLL